MGYGSLRLKVPGGKLLCVKLRYSDSIDDVQLLGDFFVHPESAVGAMEGALRGMPIVSSEDEIASAVSRAAAGAEMVGVTPDAIASAIKRVVSADVEGNRA